MPMEQLSRRIPFGESSVFFFWKCACVSEARPRLWEPGYRERYYQQKFGVENTDQEFKKKYGIYL